MKRKLQTIQSTPLKNSRELAAMLKQLPREERLRIEGIIIGVGLRCGEVAQPSPASEGR